MTEPSLEPIAQPPADPERGTLAEGLRAERQRILDLEPLDLLIPGYKTLVARYRPIAWEQAEDIVTRSGNALLESMADELIFACGGLYHLDPDGDETVDLGAQLPATKVAPGYGGEIAELLGFDAKGLSRNAVLGTFGDPDPGSHRHDDQGAGLRLSAHHDIVIGWMRGAPTKADDDGRIGQADEDFSGE